MLGTPPGSIALSTNANDTNLVFRGYVRSSNSRVVRDEWSFKPSPPVLQYFYPFAMVWIGNEVVSFGSGQSSEGGQSQFLGERLNPSNNLRRVVSTSGAPAFLPNWQLLGSAPVWTGVEVILLGYTNGIAGSRSTLSGRYNPATDSWRSLAVPSNLSSNISSASVLWTGRELIFWAGAYYGGAMYRPDLGAWTSISSAGAPSAPTPAVWTGREMIVFGSGESAGARYYPLSNVWETISEISVPELESPT